jgi:hypothetical protein
VVYDCAGRVDEKSLAELTKAARETRS